MGAVRPARGAVRAPHPCCVHPARTGRRRDPIGPRCPSPGQLSAMLAMTCSTIVELGSWVKKVKLYARTDDFATTEVTYGQPPSCRAPAPGTLQLSRGAR